MSPERIRGRLMRAGLNEDEVYAIDRPDLPEAMAKILVDGETAATAAAAVRDRETKTEIQLQFELMKMQREQMQMQHEQMQMRL